ncbi:MAG: SMP-30/gluconolactonase/LRE family protein [Fimbriimonadaceae bacterium]|nr:SMP-30/gluconolactonase/LRE family protein [Fimbriimonadaceae bacterium]
MALVANDRGLGKLVASAEAERLATGFAFTEGPLWHPDGWLLFSDIPNSRIQRWSPQTGASVFREPSGQSNGLTWDRQGRLLACEHQTRRLSRTEPDGQLTVLADRWEGRRLNSPNDVVVDRHGAIYFTDPPYGVQEPDRELRFQGVYRLSPAGQLALLADDFDRPNGLAFSPDEQTLYIDDTARMHVRAFRVDADGMLRDGRVFATFENPQRHGADGLKVDTTGRVYATGGGGCYVWEPDGTWIGSLVLPEHPANVAWGGAAGRTLFFTARSSVYRVEMNVSGVVAYPPAAL